MAFLATKCRQSLHVLCSKNRNDPAITTKAAPGCSEANLLGSSTAKIGVRMPSVVWWATQKLIDRLYYYGRARGSGHPGRSIMQDALLSVLSEALSWPSMALNNCYFFSLVFGIWYLLLYSRDGNNLPIREISGKH